ncbi:ABC transporter permease [Mesorhizobium sp. CN2-181]|uniref:ABC transporter permease n=1 Tax=Mesorhizobium yinganensis TaxID=3157707 RepID=UPI0032B76E5C
MSALTDPKSTRRMRVDSWDLLLAVLTLGVLVYGAVTTPNFLSAFNLSQLAAGVAEKALLVLPMVLLIIAREIDLSVASILALCSVVLGLLVQAGLPLIAAILLSLCFGALLGAVNGVLVTWAGLPSLVVTLGTMALFRGVGYVLLGTGSVNIFPDALTNFGIDDVPGTRIPQVIVPFLILFPLFAVALGATPFGRRVYAVGGSPAAALYSGIDIARVRFALFVLSGTVSALAGIVYTARLANARANNALGMELDVITIALLGGVSVWGGKGRLTGVLLALVLVALIRNILGINQIGGDAQGMVVGLLLIGSLLVSNSTGFLVGWLRNIGAIQRSGG